MVEFDYQKVEAWNTAVRLAAAVGRLKVASNLKASADAQAKAFETAGAAAGLVAQGASREGPAQVALYREARAAVAECSSWLHVLASVTSQQPEVFADELMLADTATRQLGALIRTLDRPQRSAGPGQRAGASGPRSASAGGRSGSRPGGLR